MSDVDQAAQSFVEGHWRAAMSSARQTMETLREVVPELSEYLPEKAADHVAGALRDAESSYRQLHQAGALVLGADEYQEYLAAQTVRRIMP